MSPGDQTFPGIAGDKVVSSFRGMRRAPRGAIILVAPVDDTVQRANGPMPRGVRSFSRGGRTAAGTLKLETRVRATAKPNKGMCLDRAVLHPPLTRVFDHRQRFFRMQPALLPRAKGLKEFN